MLEEAYAAGAVQAPDALLHLRRRSWRGGRRRWGPGSRSPASPPSRRPRRCGGDRRHAGRPDHRRDRLPLSGARAHRGRRNEPAYLPHVLAKLAEIRGWSLAEAEARTEDAFFALFDRIPTPDEPAVWSSPSWAAAPPAACRAPTATGASAIRPIRATGARAARCWCAGCREAAPELQTTVLVDTSPDLRLQTAGGGREAAGRGAADPRPRRPEPRHRRHPRLLHAPARAGSPAAWTRRPAATPGCAASAISSKARAAIRPSATSGRSRRTARPGRSTGRPAPIPVVDLRPGPRRRALGRLSLWPDGLFQRRGGPAGGAFAALAGLEVWIVDALRYTPHPTHAHVDADAGLDRAAEAAARDPDQSAHRPGLCRAVAAGCRRASNRPTTACVFTLFDKRGKLMIKLGFLASDNGSGMRAIVAAIEAGELDAEAAAGGQQPPGRAGAGVRPRPRRAALCIPTEADPDAADARLAAALPRSRRRLVCCRAICASWAEDAGALRRPHPQHPSGLAAGSAATACTAGACTRR